MANVQLDDNLSTTFTAKTLLKAREEDAKKLREQWTKKKK